MTPAPQGTPGDQRLRQLLRWYPRAWRERYGEEFLAMVEDTLDGRPPGWRLRLAVAGYGLRERGHQARRVGCRVLPPALPGALLAGGLAALPARPAAACGPVAGRADGNARPARSAGIARLRRLL